MHAASTPAMQRRSTPCHPYARMICAPRGPRSNQSPLYGRTPMERTHPPGLSPFAGIESLKRLLGLSLSIMVAACGGGAGSGDSGTTQREYIQGVAAVGAA